MEAYTSKFRSLKNEINEWEKLLEMYTKELHDLKQQEKHLLDQMRLNSPNITSNNSLFQQHQVKTKNPIYEKLFASTYEIAKEEVALYSLSNVMEVNYQVTYANFNTSWTPFFDTQLQAFEVTLNSRPGDQFIAVRLESGFNSRDYCQRYLTTCISMTKQHFKVEIPIILEMRNKMNSLKGNFFLVLKKIPHRIESAKDDPYWPIQKVKKVGATNSVYFFELK